MQNFSHQDRLFDPDRAKRVTVLGAGSVGSCLIFMLTKMGVKDVTVYDGDSIESHNTPMSMYDSDTVAEYKVHVLNDMVLLGGGVELTTHARMYEGEELKNCSVVSCVDTMSARKLIWSKVKKNPSIDLFIDTRTAGAYVEVLSIDPNNRQDIERYEALLYEDKDAVRQMCGTHGIIFASMRAAGIAAANIARYWTERKKEWRVAERCDTLIRAI